MGKNVISPQEREATLSPGIKALCDRVDKLVASSKEKQKKQDALLKELGFKLTFEDVIALLQDEERLKVVVKKLKMKAFL